MSESKAVIQVIQQIARLNGGASLEEAEQVKKMEGRICFHCKKMGHYIVDCEEYKKDMRIAQEEAQRNAAAGDKDYRKPPFSKSASSKARPTAPMEEKDKPIVLTKRAPVVMTKRAPIVLTPRREVQEKK